MVSVAIYSEIGRVGCAISVKLNVRVFYGRKDPTVRWPVSSWDTFGQRVGHKIGTLRPAHFCFPVLV